MVYLTYFSVSINGCFGGLQFFMCRLQGQKSGGWTVGPLSSGSLVTRGHHVSVQLKESASQWLSPRTVGDAHLAARRHRRVGQGTGTEC